MATKKPKMGSDPLAWIAEGEEAAAEQPAEKKKGRPATNKRIIEKSSQENLPEDWTRATFIVREDRLKKLKDYAYTDRRTLKEIVNEMIDQYLADKDIIDRGQD